MIEDNQEVSELIVYYLKSRAYAVIMVQTRDEALNVLATQSVDCILMDYMMPGLEAAPFLKTLSRQQRNATILYTGLGNAKTLAERLKVKLYLDKPFEPEELEALVARVCGR